MRHEHVEAYECEVCGTRYRSPEEALGCENGGRPTARFRTGDPVALVDGDYHRQFPDRKFRVRSSDIFLDRPGLEVWQQGIRGQHMVAYVIEADEGDCRITFVPEEHLGPWQEAAVHA